MCVGCAMAAATGVTGVRSWLQTHHMGWLTPVRLRRITIALTIAGFSVSSFGLAGSTTAHAHRLVPAAAGQYSPSSGGLPTRP
jgi:hypothetical protein